MTHVRNGCESSRVPGRRISTYDKAELFCEDYLKAASMRKA